MRECTVISRRSTCRAGSKETPAWCFALTAWLCPTADVLRFTPKLWNSITHLQARRSMWKEQSNLVAGAARASSTQRSERALVRCEAEYSAEAKEPGSDPSSAAWAVWVLPHSTDTRRSRSIV